MVAAVDKFNYVIVRLLHSKDRVNVTFKAHSREDKIGNEMSNNESVQSQTRRRFINTTMSADRNVDESWRCHIQDYRT